MLYTSVHTVHVHCQYLSISNPITVHNDPVWQRPIDAVVVLEGIGHAQLEVVRQLLASVLEHTLSEVPAEEGVEQRGREREGEGEGGEEGDRVREKELRGGGSK